MALLEQKKEYARYYGGFRGVDFSSDHTQVNESRLAYAVNMFKDYQSGQGQSLETICGFRRRVATPEGKSIYGIHSFVKDEETKILIHSGTKLYHWHNYPKTIGVVVKEGYVLGDVIDTIGTMNVFEVEIENGAESVVKVETLFNSDVTDTSSYDAETHILTVRSTLLIKGDTITVHYTEGVFKEEDILYTDMNERKSTSFVFNNRLYIIDGRSYVVYDGEKIEKVSVGAYVPTTYINIIPEGENAGNGTEYEQRNILSPYFKHTFIADGTTNKFHLNDNELEEITEVKVYGEVVSDYTADLAGGTVTFATAPKKPEKAVQIKGENGEDVTYPEFYAGIEITAKKSIKSISGVVDEAVEIENIITACTIATIFDNRVFLSGNPRYPNHIFYCGRNTTGYVDPTYFGILNYMQDGVGETAITGMIPVADSLMVLKGDTQQDGSVFFHTPTTTSDHIQPVIYPSTQGLAGTGCLGACINFLDDPVFISRLGIEGIGQLSVRYERAIEHRSSLIDAKLVNMDLTRANLAEWNGYLLVSVDGKVFMADSRQRYAHESGTPQYEWYYLEDIGVYEEQYEEYKYAKDQYDYLTGKTVKICADCLRPIEDCECGKNNVIEIPLVVASEVMNAETGVVEDLRGLTANPPTKEGNASCEVFYEVIKAKVTDDEETPEVSFGVNYIIHKIYNIYTGESKGYEALLCESGKGAHTGGVFCPATIFKTIDYNLFFGVENGDICSFNFDKREDNGEIAPRWYSFNERAILSGCATKMDNCGIPHLTKTTVKKSTVIKTKTFSKSAAKVKVRTNKKAYNQIARINSGIFSFDDMDFSDFSFNTEGQTLYAVKEKEKKWVEKQYYIFSDEYQRPFALYYISYRYTIAGRYKE